MQKTPVLLILFNRPKYTTLIIRQIKKYSPNKLYIHCDGPREGHQFDKKNCEEIRNIIKKEISWNCKKKIIFQKKNIGLRKSAISAINFLFKNETKGIILEDSTFPNKSFFEFCDKLLIKYRTNKKISIISGYNPIIDYKIVESYTFSELPKFWGWATWRSSWRLSNWKMKNWPKNKKSEWMKHKLKKPFFFRFYWEKIFQDTFSEKTKTWDYNVVYSNWFNNTYSIVPKYNLVRNLDINDKINTHKNNFKLKLQNKELEFPLMHPKKILVNQNYDKIFYKKFYNFKFFFFNIYIARTYKNLFKKFI